MSGTIYSQDKTITILSAGDMSGDLISDSIDVQGVSNYSIQAVYSGSPVGTMKLKISMDGIIYTDYTGSSVSISASGDTFYKINRNGERYVQLTYTFSSG